MSTNRFSIGMTVMYEGSSARLLGRVGTIKRVRRDELNPENWNYSVQFGRDTWKVHERNLAPAVMAKPTTFRNEYMTSQPHVIVRDPEPAQHAQLAKDAINRLVEKKVPLVLKRVDEDKLRTFYGQGTETGRIASASPLAMGAQPEPMPIGRGSRVEITGKCPCKGMKGNVVRLWSGSLGALMVDVELDSPPRDWIGNRASFHASFLAPLVEQKQEPRGLWKDGKKVKVLDFTKILHPKGTMHGPVDGMIMANALKKTGP